MLLKLATRNIRRSVKDYSIYFITLTIGVALFYAFNSIHGQQILFDMESKATSNLFEVTQELISIFSAVIAGVMGFLVIYANRFLIKRRKKEFGIYLLLGMKPLNVSTIVLLETLIVGFVALVLGLLLGLALSQGLCFITAAMFETTLSEYQFVFSELGCILTLVCFVVIFVVVALFNVVSVNAQKLINLFYADEKNERGRIRNPWVSFVFFVASIGIIAFAYSELIESRMIQFDDPHFITATVCMLIGSLIFFWSLAGFVIAIIPRFKRFYYSGIRSFTIRQVASKVNTAFLTLWAICIMLFFSITVFSTGMGLLQAYTKDVDAANPYDASVLSRFIPQADSSTRDVNIEMPPEEIEDVSAVLQTADPAAWSNMVEASAEVMLTSYDQFGYDKLFNGIDLSEFSKTLNLNPDMLDNLSGYYVSLISFSQLNESRALAGEASIDATENDCIMVNTFDAVKDLAKAVVTQNKPVNIEGQTLHFLPEVSATQLYDSATLDTSLVVAIPDALFDQVIEQGHYPDMVILNVKLREDADSGGDAFEDYIDTYKNTTYLVDWPIQGSAEGLDMALQVTSTFSRDYMIEQSRGMRMLVTYLALYIGLIFLMATATIIALQQLSNATDSVSKYALLNKLGCERRTLNHSLLAQIALYFLVPLGLAICHSACAIYVLNDVLISMIGGSLIEPIAFSALLVLGIYGTYFIVTYLISKGIVRGGMAN